jgi:hypothetical protein
LKLSTALNENVTGKGLFYRHLSFPILLARKFGNSLNESHVFTQLCSPEILCPLRCINSCNFVECRHLKPSHKIPLPDTCPLRGRPDEYEDFRKAQLRLTDDCQRNRVTSRQDLWNSCDESLPQIILIFAVLTAVNIIFVMFIVGTKLCSFVGRYQPLRILLLTSSGMR